MLNSETLDACRSNVTTISNCITTLTLKDKAGSLVAPRNYIYPKNALKNIALPATNISVRL